MLYLLWVVAALLLLVWMIGVAGSLSLGNGIHLLLVAAIVAIGITLLARPRVV
jgi:hypothetical protein